MYVQLYFNRKGEIPSDKLVNSSLIIAKGERENSCSLFIYFSPALCCLFFPENYLGGLQN